MIDLERIAGFDWDDGNSRKSADKHRVGQAEAEQVFLNILRFDCCMTPNTARLNSDTMLDGKTHAGRLLQIAFTSEAGCNPATDYFSTPR